MSIDFSKYKHREVFEFFEQINNIPRESGNEKQISDFLKKFAEDRKFYVRQDEYNNIVIKKPGTLGYENRPAVIIQGHMDMVCVKANDSSHDFKKDPLKMYIDGDLLKAKDTTLGADNGIALAMVLALLDSKKIPHPPIEFAVTTDEETGLIGAVKMEMHDLEGKYFLNLDSEEEGEFVVCCAGGTRLGLFQKIIKNEKSPHNCRFFKIQIKDLAGGHSGMEIDKNRANANRLLGRTMYELKNELNAEFIKINGGVKDNVIPSYAMIDVLIPHEKAVMVNDLISRLQKTFRSECGIADENISLSADEIIVADKNKIQILSGETVGNAIFILMNSPAGIQSMTAEIPGLVQSSLNLGVVEQKDDVIEYVWALRSSVLSLKCNMINQMKLFAEKFNLEMDLWGDYPSWPLKPKSKLEQICTTTFKKMYGKDPLVKGIHAGLEGGVFLEKLPHLEAISFGPDMWEVHSINERLSISSTERVYDFMKEILIQLD